MPQDSLFSVLCKALYCFLPPPPFFPMEESQANGGMGGLAFEAGSAMELRFCSLSCARISFVLSHYPLTMERRKAWLLKPERELSKSELWCGSIPVEGRSLEPVAHRQTLRGQTCPMGCIFDTLDQSESKKQFSLTKTCAGGKGFCRPLLSPAL